MPIITPPSIVQNALDEFLAPLFKNETQRKHIAHYITGITNTVFINWCPMLPTNHHSIDS